MQFDGVVFPGQGSQRLGMGKDFSEIYKEAKLLFELASDTLKFDVFDICQNHEEQLNNTAYTQPCILTVQMAMYHVLAQHYDLQPQFFAGHSLGEYAALTASGVIPFPIVLKMAHFRGQLMQSVVTDKPSSMAAIIMDVIPFEQINSIANQHNVDIANDNSEQQVVLSGYTNDIKATISQLETIFADKMPMRVVYLNVSAPFHSRYMQTIEPDFKDYILQFTDKFNPNHLSKVISNFHGGFYPDNSLDSLITGLTKQISGSVKWRSNMQHLTTQTNKILELGPGSPLRGFFKSIGTEIKSIINVKTLDKLLAS
jgi:malonyl CoA-acyl carrier protein transacylase